MQGDTKKLGEMLVASGLITAGQLQEALRHQRITGGRMGSNLVAMGFISDDLLMDFLAQQTGVPRLDVRHLNLPHAVLERIPRRLAEQLVILPVAFKEPKSLVLAMADPSDLNAIDSARFASGMTIEPVVASHSALKLAIAEQYHRMETGSLDIPVVDGGGPSIEIADGLPLPFVPTPLAERIPLNPSGAAYPKDPFFGAIRTPVPPVVIPPAAPDPGSPFSFFPEAKPVAPPPLKPQPKPTDSQIVHVRSLEAAVPPLESYGDRALVLGLVRFLQRRGILAEGELPRLLANMVDAKEIDPDV
jgi:hypothetical protein